MNIAIGLLGNFRVLTPYGWVAVSKAQPQQPDTFTDNMDRSDVLDMVESAMQEAHSKVESGRVYDPENEKIRIKWVKAVGYLANQHRQIQRDKDLEELSEEVERLKEQYDQ